jgi:molybdate transport system substrate-binding protein
VLLLACRGSSAIDGAPIRVAAAADLALAFEELGRAFERHSGRRVSLTLGSSGLLAMQIREGAPFDLFAAANVSFVEEVVASGACDGATKEPYGRGRLAIWTRGAAGHPESIEELAGSRFARVAIANPEHAPYGLAARQALDRAGVLEELRARLVFGENVRQTLQFAESGNVEAAIVALSLVMQREDGVFTPVPESLHDLLEQALVVCRHGASFEGGRAFALFVSTPAAREVMGRHGFLLPGEAGARR